MKTLSIIPFLIPFLISSALGATQLNMSCPNWDTFVCYGNSLTYGAGANTNTTSYPAQLAAMMGKQWINKGVGGYNSHRVAALQGGKTVSVTVTGGVIPANGPCSILFESNAFGGKVVDQWTPFDVFGTIGGVCGKIIYEAPNNIFTRTNSGDPVTFSSGSFLMQTDGNEYKFQIIWPGFLDRTSTTEVESNIAKMVSFIKMTNPRWIVMTEFPYEDGTENIGSAGYTQVMNLNAATKAAYPNNTFDVYEYMLAQGDGSTDDNSDIANGLVPRSKRFDNLVHLNAAGYKCVAVGLKNFINSRGW